MTSDRQMLRYPHTHMSIWVSELLTDLDFFFGAPRLRVGLLGAELVPSTNSAPPGRKCNTPQWPRGCDHRGGPMGKVTPWAWDTRKGTCSQDHPNKTPYRVHETGGEVKLSWMGRHHL
jgi:hypothetical protein